MVMPSASDLLINSLTQGRQLLNTSFQNYNPLRIKVARLQ
jgi:hypothetical protein